MFLKSVDIVNFRNYSDLSLELGPNINIIYGENAQGKTNLLESIYFLALTKSHRSFIDDNLIKDKMRHTIRSFLNEKFGKKPLMDIHLIRI